MIEIDRLGTFLAGSSSDTLPEEQAVNKDQQQSEEVAVEIIFTRLDL